jgi:D-alanine transaminase
MSRIAYVNGQYVPHRHAAVPIEDRGYQFADGVYEVIAVQNGELIDLEPHFERLDRSLREISIGAPMSRRALAMVIDEVARRNAVHNGIVYLQVTRGVAPRDHGFPKNAKPALVITARNTRPKTQQQQRGVSVITLPDLRWKRCDIKSVALLPNVLGKQKAVDAGAYEAWMIDDDGNVTEGTASNAWIVTDKDELVTRHTDTAILSGVTRLAVRALAAEHGLTLVERAFSAAEAKAAREAFLTSTTSNVMPVVRIDDARIGDGKPGPVTRHLGKLYSAHADGA